MKRLLAALFVLAASGPILAGQSESFGPWEVHYSTLNTTLLDPETASAYGIQRAGGQVLLSVTLLRTDGEEGPAPHPATVQVTARNLAGQRRTLEMREAVDGDAIYYLGEFRVRGEETMIFNVRVTPRGQARPALEFSFQQALEAL